MVKSTGWSVELGELIPSPKLSFIIKLLKCYEVHAISSTYKWNQ